MLKKAFNFITNNPSSNPPEVLSKLAPLKKLANSFLFVHIPKTAGTSFRKSVENQHPTTSDYGKDSPQTSDIIKEYWYKQQNMYGLKSILDRENRMFSGHFISQKYLDFVDARHIVSFVRDPLEQVVSHYNHYVTHLGYEGEFNDFITIPGYCNIQSRYLHALPVALYGFIGLTENYEESLEFINNNYDLEIKSIQDNISQQKIQTKDALMPEQCEGIKVSNSQDVTLVNQVRTLFAQRLIYQKNKKPWVHAWGDINSSNLLAGCAYYEKSDEAVELEFFINNKLVKECKANQFTGLYPKALFPRARYVGFHINLNAFKDVTYIQVKVKGTGQSVYTKSF